MKIFMYSDLHISRTSSIMPTLSNSKYTYRQQMILDIGKYMANIIDEEKPDVIINLGDTFDQHTITSYDIHIASEFFKCFRMFNIPHLVLVGNHEMINQNFNAIQLLGNINNITVITEPCTVDSFVIKPDSEKIQLAFLPYCDYKEILEFPAGQILFSHQDIQGSSVRGDFTLPDGIEPNVLKTKYKLVFNGHIHKPSISGNIVNVGSVATHSFSDDDKSVPQCYIFDTDTSDLKTFKLNVCPLFRKVEITDIQELYNYISSVDKQYKYILQVVCSFELKEIVKQILDDNKDLIISYRLNVKVNKSSDSKAKEESALIADIQSNLDINKSFSDFLNTVDLKFPKQLYLDIIK